jgi:flagellar hook protein FlgE
MSLFGAMITGVGGLDANSAALSVTSSNIANVSTTGYKASTSAFSTLLAQVSGSSSNSGVKQTSEQQVTSQGLLTATSSDTDLAISGDGFFITSTSSSDTSSVEYTRAGDFSTDKDGNLVNSAGLYLLGYSLDTTSTTTSSTQALTLINTKNISGTAEASTAITLTGNLESTTTADTSSYSAGDMASGTTTADFTSSVDYYDSQGGSQTLKISYVKTAANTWAYEVTSTSADVTGDSTGATTSLLATGTLTFNSDGTLATVTTSSGTATAAIDTTDAATVDLGITYDSSSGLSGATQSLAIDFGTISGTDGLTQYATSSTYTSTTDGYAYSDVSSVSIGTDGIVTATYTSGLTKDVYQIPLATFANADGLKSVSGTAYVATESSGSPTITTAGDSGSGTIQADELEDSTVDLATELTDLITTQRAYTACAKIVTTATNMIDVLVNMGS